MKQPLMIIPPAQAEALYDAALENADHGKRTRIHEVALTAEWDDQGSSDNLDDGLFGGALPQGAPVRPALPLRPSYGSR